MKKLLSVLLAGAIMTTLAVPAFAQTNDYTIGSIEGTLQNWSAYAGHIDAFTDFTPRGVTSYSTSSDLTVKDNKGGKIGHDNDTNSTTYAAASVSIPQSISDANAVGISTSLHKVKVNGTSYGFTLKSN